MLTNVRGTRDILPDEIPIWQYVERQLMFVSQLFGFKEIRTPIIERTEVFLRSLGEETDIVNKEMYTFLDRSGDSITLRPEMTAPVVRAVLQNNMLFGNSVLRLWYYGSLFRYERPQKGRMRQFTQYGAELINSFEPEADAEIISLANSLVTSIGINNYKLILNSIGDLESRNKYKEELISYLSKYRNELSDESKIRLERNPLRILDSKDPNDQKILQSAPKILDFLNPQSQKHFEQVQDLLAQLQIKYEIQPLLVRGLDYYTHTVFELQSEVLGAQNSFGGGGRYNDLFQIFGGKQIPAIGFALGIERIILILKEQNNLANQSNRTLVYITVTDAGMYTSAIKIADLLRKNNIPTIYDLQKRTLKAQLKEANKISAKYSIILGEDELRNNQVAVKNLNTSSQELVAIDNLVSYLKMHLEDE